MNTPPGPDDSPQPRSLQHRLLALLDDPAGGGELTPSRLAALLSAPVAEVEAQLKTLVQLGTLTQRPSENGEAHYSLAPKRKSLGTLLVEAGYLTQAQLKEALAEQARTGEQLSSILLNRGYVSKQTLGQILGAQHGVAYIDLNTSRIDEQVVRSLPEGVIMHHKVLPIARAGGKVHLAMVNPTDVVAVDTVGRLLSAAVLPILILEGDFDWAVTKFFDVSRRVGESLLEVPSDERGTGNAPPSRSATNTVILRLSVS